MLILVAENGRSCELDCQASTSVDTLQKTLATLLGIPAHEQILICGDTKLESSKVLGAYKLPQDDKRLFLFNKARLMYGAAPPPPEEVDMVDPQIPAGPSMVGVRHPLDDSESPLLQALPNYERQFKFHLQKGRAIWVASQERFKICQRLVEEQAVQEQAIQTGRNNMGIYYKHICHQHKDFMRAYNRQYKYHSDLLGNFEKEMERLRGCELHPALQADSRRTLLDCVKEGEIRQWAADCSLKHTQFNAKVADLASLFAELQRSVQELENTPLDVDVCQLSFKIDDSQKFIEEQTSILTSLNKDLNTVKKMVNDCVDGLRSQDRGSVHLATSLRPLDVINHLDPMNHGHSSFQLPKVEECDRRLAHLLLYLRDRKNDMSRCVHNQLQKVAALQSKIRDMRFQLAAYREALDQQEKHFDELVRVHRVRPAYRVCLAEIVLRKAYSDWYKGQAAQLAEKIARIRDSEVARREEFVQQQSLYISREILERMGLYGQPSQCEVSVPPFDTDLLDVEMEDLQKWAPESLYGSVEQSGSKMSSSGKKAEGKATSPGSNRPPRTDDSAGVDGSGANNGGLGDLMDSNKLEMENARLKAELASAIAMLCACDPERFMEEGAANQAEGSEDGGGTAAQAQKVAEALHLKDEYGKQLQQQIAQQKDQMVLLVQLIKDLEARLVAQPTASTVLQAERETEDGGGAKEGMMMSDREQREQDEQKLMMMTLRGGSEAASTWSALQAAGGRNMTKGNEIEGSRNEDVGESSVVTVECGEDAHGGVGVSGGGEGKGGQEDDEGTSVDANSRRDRGKQVEDGKVLGPPGDVEEMRELGSSEDHAMLDASSHAAHAAHTGQHSHREGGGACMTGVSSSADTAMEDLHGGTIVHGEGDVMVGDNTSAVMSGACPDGSVTEATGRGGDESGMAEEGYRDDVRANLGDVAGAAGIEGTEEQPHANVTMQIASCHAEPPPRSQEQDAELNALDVLKRNETEVAHLRNALAESAAACNAADERVKALTAEVSELHALLKRKEDLLSESQVNCAHLEHLLHEAREEARTNHCAANSGAARYTALRNVSIKQRGLMGRFARAIPMQGPEAAVPFPDALITLAKSLSSTVAQEGDDGLEWFRASIRSLAEHVYRLALEKDQAVETHMKILKQMEMDKNLNVNDIAVFMRNAEGFYVASFPSRSNYYLSNRSIGVSTGRDHGRTSSPHGIVGRIVQIERHIVRPPAASDREEDGTSGRIAANADAPSDVVVGSSSPASRSPGAGSGAVIGGASGESCAVASTNIGDSAWNPFGLAAGTDFFVVTLAAIPGVQFSGPPSSGR